ncbi:hypothetical protein [Rhodococcus sp. NPDC127528]|uniref:hypothetical protein n=1 Tax=unclassified Rhodococcus (in: high G+C Gram-positive bacteria) TaxID=192944 RepID=UPI00363C9F1D
MATVTKARERDPPVQERFSMITNAVNFVLGAVGGVFAGSSGYQIPPGTLPNGS